MSIFGTVFSGVDMEDAVTNHLKAWNLTYLAQAERERGLEPRTLPPIKSFVNVPREPDSWPEDQLPALLIVSTGTTDPFVHGDGWLGTTWNIGLAAIVSAATERRTHELAHWYFMAAVLPMLRNSGLKGNGEVDYADNVECSAWTYEVIPVERRRTLAAVYGVLQVTVEQVLNLREGPVRPLDDPYGDSPEWPDVDRVVIDVEKP